jgi:hypothetical protein
VASTTRTKAMGWATGLAEERGATYHDRRRRGAADAVDGPIGGGGIPSAADDSDDGRVVAAGDADDAPVATPRLRSILEAALPAFLLVCLALRLANARDGVDDRDGSPTISPTMAYALRRIVLGTTCCVLAASSTADGTAGGSSRSTLLMVSSSILGT